MGVTAELAHCELKAWVAPGQRASMPARFRGRFSCGGRGCVRGGVMFRNVCACASLRTPFTHMRHGRVGKCVCVKP